MVLLFILGRENARSYVLIVPQNKKSKHGCAMLGSTDLKTDPMHSFVASHESRDLKQARPYGQDVDLLRKNALATPSLLNIYNIFAALSQD